MINENLEIIWFRNFKNFQTYLTALALLIKKNIDYCIKELFFSLNVDSNYQLLKIFLRIL